MRNEDFIKLMMKLETRKIEIRESKGKTMSDIDHSIIAFIDELIFELLEEQSDSLKPTPQVPLFRGAPQNIPSTPTTSAPSGRDITKAINER